MRAAFLLLLLSLSVVACGRAHNPDATRVRPASTTIDLALARSVVDEVVPRVERLRALEFRDPVRVEVVDDAEARELFIAQFERMDLDDGFDVTTRAYRLLGLLDERPAMEVLLGALEDQAGGFYDPELETYYLLDDMPAAAVEILTAHELVHALEDQHFDLAARIEGSVESDDLSFAVRSVHEGSATLIMTAYMMEAIDEGRLGLGQLAAASQGMGTPQELPEIFARLLAGPYVLGAQFLSMGDSSAAMTGAFDAERVATAFERGPVSSEQILHPEKYWDPEQRDDPLPVSLPDVGELLGADWNRAGAGDLGELVLAILTEPEATVGLSMTSAGYTNAAAAGWGGDRWELWSDGERDVLVALIEWDSESDAEEFEAALAGRNISRAGQRVALVAGEAPIEAARLLADD